MQPAIAASAKPAIAKSVAYAKSVYDVLSAAGAQFNAIAEAQTAELGKQLDLAILSATKDAPAEAKPTVAFAKSALSAATSAADELAKVTKQVLAAAEANVAAVFAALEKPLARA